VARRNATVPYPEQPTSVSSYAKLKLSQNLKSIPKRCGRKCFLNATLQNARQATTLGMMADNLIAFFDGSGGDYQGRTLSSVLQWPDEMLELSHDYIQTLFPIPERSSMSYNATVVDKKVFEAFHFRPELRASLLRAFERILLFYGLKLIEHKGNIKVCLKFRRQINI
jgi:hypothetical protein